MAVYDFSPRLRDRQFLTKIRHSYQDRSRQGVRMRGLESHCDKFVSANQWYSLMSWLLVILSSVESTNSSR